MSTAEIMSESTMTAVLEAYPGAQRALFRRYHIGGCSSCGFSPEDQLGDVLKKHDVSDTNEVIQHIKASHQQEQDLQVSAAELSKMLAQTPPARLIDVRGPEEQEIAKIAGALSASQELVQEIKESWPKDTVIVVYCHKGMRSLDAASYLIGHGFTNVRSLTGGVDAWAQEVDTALARY
jgi:rhodanese-related sulfurtransferase